MTSVPDLARQRLEELVSFFGINAKVDVRNEDDGIVLDIASSPLTPRLIGHHGETLRAIEYLVQHMVKAPDDVVPRISVDVAGYREARRGTLEDLARATADRVIASGLEEELRPMNPSERRIVHLALRERPGIVTESRGENRTRRIVVLPDSRP